MKVIARNVEGNRDNNKYWYNDVWMMEKNSQIKKSRKLFVWRILTYRTQCVFKAWKIKTVWASMLPVQVKIIM